MQHLCKLPLRGRQTFVLLPPTCQGQVRFFALIELSHILHRLCRPPSISLSFNLATVLPRRHIYRVSFATDGVDSAHSKCAPFRARTTRVSNPVCSPSFRASVSGVVQGLAFATGVPLDIYAFHCYTENSSPPPTLKRDSIQCHFRVEPGDFTSNLPCHLRTLYAQ